ncbi:hypothetical protein ESB00_09915 [Oleiharenicola lentus]|uniref:DUF1761 domain-containing protein n=1 Tax=Oleiharenicola lentus TaxID=2508720 RepID=A0A4Q1CAQ8_9BACT|nr:hypothetical protein [Oleiharenicola lentus]RXK56165.1 hypothetical protein ESB00_09915 [Oleiharenicola lentus]
MNLLLSLWLPILLSAVVVFVISSLVHMVLKWHASDYNRLPNEDAVRAALNAGNPAPGRYVVPHCTDMKEMAGEAMQRKYQEGPVGHITLGSPGQPSMGKPLGLWFLMTLVVSTVAAYVAVKFVRLDPSQALRAAKLVGTISFVSYGFGAVPESIWMLRPWSSTAKYLIDSALYALGTAAVFWWLWG